MPRLCPLATPAPTRPHPRTLTHAHGPTHGTRTRMRMRTRSGPHTTLPQARPNYEIAPDGPLLLHEIGYEGLAWEYPQAG